MAELKPYIMSSSELQEGFWYALPFEAEQLHLQVGEIKESRSSLSVHISEAMEQSSETWHDNAPADALFGEMRQLDIRQKDLVVAERFLIPVNYPTIIVPFATIGSRVLCSMGGDEFELDIIGDLPISQSGMDDAGIIERSSCAAPLARALLGAQANSTVQAEVNDRVIEIDVLAIDQNAQWLAHQVASA
jgi:transcription elongation GreA/GreB family factor